MSALTVMGQVGGESLAHAGTLENSVRVGDRSRMHIVRLPRPGEKRFGRTPATGSLTRPGGGGPGPQDWFWEIHSTDASAAAPMRWAAALETLRARRSAGRTLTAESTLDAIVARHGSAIAAAAERHTVSAALLAAVIAVESAGRVTAVSPAGARGLMQLIPATASRFGVADSFDPRQNVQGGAAYLSWLLNRFGQDTILALAGYNAGEGAVDKHRGVPPFRETRDYVVRVFDALSVSERLCAVPPASPRHPCDWRVAGG